MSVHDPFSKTLCLKLTEKQVCLSIEELKSKAYKILSANLTYHFENAWDKSYDRWVWKTYAWSMCGITKAKSPQKITLKDLCGKVLSKMPIAICKTTTYTLERSNATYLFIISSLSQDFRWYKLLGEYYPVICNVQSLNNATKTALWCKQFQHFV